MKFMNIEFVPLNVPLQRRRQTFAVCLCMLICLNFLSLFALTVLAFLLLTPLFCLPFLYFIFYWWDFDSCEKGGYNVQLNRKSSFWKWFANYFPVSLIKTVDLDPSKNYLFGVHPHGIMCCGVLSCFASDGCGFSEKFPGLTPHCLTLKANFYGPFTREFNLCNGTCVASKECMQYILTNQGRCKQKGQTCVLVPGGAEESLHVQPQTYKLILKHRKGFIKAALNTGASLVPVISFGENDVYSTVQFEKNTFQRKIQDNLKKWTSIGFPVLWGRGILNYTFGALPRRVPIYVVVGKPIDVERIKHPTQEQVDALHARYIEELTSLFEQHKHKYVADKSVKLVIQ